MSIWFTSPGVPPSLSADPDTDLSWYTQALPVGNGKLAAMVYGGVASEQIQFNEDTIWCGQPHDYTNPNSTLTRLRTIQTNCFNRVDILTDAQNYLMGIPIREATYEAPGAMVLTFPHSGTANYLRSLNLSNATVNVHYDYDSVTYNRDIFASAPSNKVIVIHFRASSAGKIAFTCSFATKQTATFSTIGNDLVMHASVSAIGDYRYYLTGLTNAVKYDARVRLIATGGSVSSTSSSLSVTNADDVTLLLSVASNVKSYNDLTADYVMICSNNIAAAATMGYTALRQAQQDDYKTLFDRVVLDLGTSSKTSLEIGYRKKQIGSDGNDPNLVTLAFQLGRYLMISGSRPGSQALNLQGKWNNLTNLYGYWGSKMTLNINEEMNYWGAEVANLSECTGPLFDMIQDLSVTGNKVAKSNYFSDGWVAHHNTDLWRDAAACNTTDGIWPTGGAWLCQHLWWHYQYTGDTNWLATNGYPLMKGAAQFFVGFLVPHKTNANWLVTCPSYSPEHNWKSGSTEVANVPGPTMDNELLRDLFKHVIEASQILGVDYSFRTNLAAIRDKLPPEKAGQYGQLQEWIEDIDANPDNHRHCSHLVGLSPGDEISPFYTPSNALAAKVSVDFRGDAKGDTPWSRAVRINLRTRLQDGDHAYLNLTNLLADSKVSTNLVFGDGSYGKNHQVDFIFGTLSGIAEMFLQSQSGEVFLLPALPSNLTNGMVSGLCARGGFEVDNMSWTNGKLASATILSKLGNPCRLRTKLPVDIRLGTNYVDAPMVLPGLYQFTTIAGSNYTVTAAYVAETENLSTTFSAGDTNQIVTNAALSNMRGTLLTANATNDYVAYGVSNMTAGNYHVCIGADAGTNRGEFQLACGPSGGALTNVGPVQDTYSATNMIYLLPINLYTPTNLIILWTNMLKEFDCGTWQAPSDGNYDFKFTVVDKNASSSGYNLALDYIKLTPAPNQPSSSNSAPTDIALSNSTVPENQPMNTVVGYFSTTDPDSGNTFTYSLVGGDGSTNNDSFTISSNALLTAVAFDFETENSYSIRVRSTDQGGLSFEKMFTITVTDTNEAPTDISLSNSTVPENQPPGTIVGAFSTTDPDSGNTFTYSLVSGDGSTNNDSFTISGNALLTAVVFDFETKNSYSIRVQSTDQGGLSFAKAFTITVTDVNEAPAAPTNLVPVDSALNQSPSLTLQASSFSDPDAGDTHAASQWLVRRTADGVLVFDSGEDLTNLTNLTLPSGLLDYAVTHNWQVRYEDSHTAWSGYSAATAFSTVAPTLSATAQGNDVVLSWPTNTASFFLQYATDLPATNWIPASPAPAMVEGRNVVTNAVAGEKSFYRLTKS